MDLTTARIVDLTQPLGPSTAVWPGEIPVRLVTTATVGEDGWFARDLTTPEHAGTHVDAPAHITAGTATVDLLPPARLVRPVVMIDASAHVGDRPDAVVGADVIRADESARGRVASGDVVLVRTGWDRHLADIERYVGTRRARCPGIDAGAAELLVRRGVAGIGIDTMSVERGADADLPVHRRTSAAGVWHLEGLVGLDGVPPRGAWIVVAPLRLVGGSGAPARVFALVPDAAPDGPAVLPGR